MTDFPKLPAGEQWHNPKGLTPEQVGVSDGWRLLIVGETIPYDYEWWYSIQEKWSNDRCYQGRKTGEFNYDTAMRTREPLPFKVDVVEYFAVNGYKLGNGTSHVKLINNICVETLGDEIKTDQLYLFNGIEPNTNWTSITSEAYEAAKQARVKVDAPSEKSTPISYSTPTTAERLNAERGAEYGHPIDDFGCAQDMYSAWILRRNDAQNKGAKELPPEQEKALRHAVLMLCVKLSRAAQSPQKVDHWDDVQGYAGTVKMILGVKS